MATHRNYSRALGRVPMDREHEHDGGERPVDLDGYLARIGYTESLDPTIETLRGLHFAHATQIPFENLDILLGRPIVLDLESLQSKLVVGRRGGYCFEQNTLFAAVLESLGFAVTRLAARVRFGSTSIRPRSHMLLSVEIDREPWLADVGFGGEGLLYPIRLDQHDAIDQGAWIFRVKDEGNIQVLQSLHTEGWFDLYAFTREPQYPVDFVVSNHCTSTYPHSPFVQSLVVQRTGLDARWTLRNRELTEQRPGRQTTTSVPDDDALLVTLAEVFGLHFPAVTRFRNASSSTAPTG
jgi:N-hydroxyarylamine O-acetyltransferase